MPQESLSRVSSYDWFGSLAFYPVGMAIWGPVADLIGTSAALWVATAALAATTTLLLSLPAIRQLRAYV